MPQCTSIQHNNKGKEKNKVMEKNPRNTCFYVELANIFIMTQKQNNKNKTNRQI
jgi:hypothetical protein